MAQDPVPPDAGAPYSRPWVVLLAGLALTIPAWLLNATNATSAVWPFLLALAATLVAAVAVILQLRQADWRWPERLESAAFVSVAGLVALVCYLAMGKELDSGRMFYGAAFLVALAGAVLILLSSLGRRIAISLVIVFHFGGILTAVASVDPPGHTGPWISKQLWTWVYRPYLSFLYLTNAYHFYSPEPGPATLFWFAVHYSDGNYTWVKMPDRATSPHGIHYNRLLALPQYTFLAGIQPLTASQLHQLPDDSPFKGREAWEIISARRVQGTELLRYRDRTTDRLMPIPIVHDMDPNLQFSEPTDVSKKLIASVAKRVLTHHAPPAQTEGAYPVSVKMYRVVHQILTPYELARGVSPFAKNKHLPYFLGEFDTEGRLKDSRERFLYWYIPIAYVPGAYPEHGLIYAPGVPSIQVRSPAPQGGYLLDCLELHAAGHTKIIPQGEGNP